LVHCKNSLPAGVGGEFMMVPDGFYIRHRPSHCCRPAASGRRLDRFVKENLPNGSCDPMSQHYVSCFNRNQKVSIATKAAHC
jgi:hypothetical protein